jgi:F-type H+-transporting ATPase subunit alpha
MKTETLVAKIQEQIEGFQANVDINEFGIVQSVADGVARVSGLSQCQASEMISFDNGVVGVALNLEEDTVGVILLGDYLGIKEGDQARRTGKQLMPLFQLVEGSVSSLLVIAKLEKQRLPLTPSLIRRDRTLSVST